MAFGDFSFKAIDIRLLLRVSQGMIERLRLKIWKIGFLFV